MLQVVLELFSVLEDYYRVISTHQCEGYTCGEKEVRTCTQLQEHHVRAAVALVGLSHNLLPEAQARLQYLAQCLQHLV